MSQSIHFSVQTYRRDVKGRLVKGQWKACSSAIEATKRAETIVANQKAVGAIAISQRTRGEFDEGEPPMTIAEFGSVPPSVRDMIPF